MPAWLQDIEPVYNKVWWLWTPWPARLIKCNDLSATSVLCVKTLQFGEVKNTAVHIRRQLDPLLAPPVLLLLVLNAVGHGFRRWFWRLNFLVAAVRVTAIWYQRSDAWFGVNAAFFLNLFLNLVSSGVSLFQNCFQHYAKIAESLTPSILRVWLCTVVAYSLCNVRYVRHDKASFPRSHTSCEGRSRAAFEGFLCLPCFLFLRTFILQRRLFVLRNYKRSATVPPPPDIPTLSSRAAKKLLEYFAQQPILLFSSRSRNFFFFFPFIGKSIFLN